MGVLKYFKALALLGTLATGLSAGDYDDLMAAVKLAWPEKAKGAAICSVDFNQLALLDLTDSAKGQGFSLVILNVKSPRELEKTLGLIFSRTPEFLVLIDEDPVLGIKSAYTKHIIARAKAYKIPTVALTSLALRQGALLAVGPDTQGKVLVNAKLAKEMGFTVPEGFVLQETK